MTLKATKNQGFTLSLKNFFLEKPWEDRLDPLPPPPPSLLRGDCAPKNAANKKNI